MREKYREEREKAEAERKFIKKIISADFKKLQKLHKRQGEMIDLT